MISFLSGTLAEKTAPFLIIETHGVGYEVQASLNTFAQLPALGEAVKLLTHFVVREDAQQLFGFAEANERILFRTLIKVNGVGPKLALAILSGMSVQEFRQCLLNNDIKTLTRLPGVGKKTAERLIVEMKDRMAEWSEDPSQQSIAVQPVQASTVGVVSEAETALIALGYKPTEASKAIAKLSAEQLSTTEEAIRAALKAM